jgi:2-oxoisovalerate dehydrogenase E2 component (dihydrolipoyl transacylase)
MPVPITMPKLGETVVDGTVARWHKRPGERVDKLEPLLDISTDKIDTEVPSPAAGTLTQIVVEEGATVEAGTVLAYIDDGAEIDEGRKTEDEPATALASTDKAAEDSARPQGRTYISPVVARMAAEHNIDLDQIPGSGLHGRITKKDVLRHIGDWGLGTGDRGQGIGDSHEIVAAPIPQSPNPPIASPQSPVPSPLSSMRRAIAEHMTRSVRTSPHVTTIHEVDMTAVVRHREEVKGALAAKGVRLTFTPYFVAATAAALQAVPRANSRFSEDGLIFNPRVHIGVAVAVDDGLLVPVIRDADERNLTGLARAVNDVAERARQGKLQPDELQGGTFTLTNHGVAGSLVATPIINQPQSGILGIGAIVKRPVVRSGGHPLLPSADDAIVIRPMCYLSFSFDHRVLDGAEADEFVGKVKAILENWTGEHIVRSA